MRWSKQTSLTLDEKADFFSKFQDSFNSKCSELLAVLIRVRVFDLVHDAVFVDITTGSI